MAASPLAHPWPDPLRPGPAWAWQPPRPFPALIFRASLAVAAPRPPSARAPSLPRHDLELRVLLSQLQPALDAWFLEAFRQEAARRAWRADLALHTPRLPAASPPATRPTDTLADRRERLLDALEQGLRLASASAGWLSRPERNHHLAWHAAQIGRRARELARHPAAGPLARELQLLVAALARHR